MDLVLVAKSHQIDVPSTPPDHFERNLLLELQRREIKLAYLVYDFGVT